MSVNHMLARGTLARNIEMAFALDCTGRIEVAKGARRLVNASAKNSIQRLQRHITEYIKNNPHVWTGANPRRNAYKAFASTYGVEVNLLHANSRHVTQKQLF